MKRNRTVFLFIVALLVVVPLFAACGATATPTAVPTKVAPTAAPTQPPTAVPPTKVPPTATAVPPTATAAPKVGGKLVIAYGDPDTLDPRKAMWGTNLLLFMEGTLVARDMKTGTIAPYLAQSWTISSDGLTYDFKLRKDVKFWDGTPLTAQDYAWSMQQYITTTSKSFLRFSVLAGVTSVEAVDDYTMRFKLSKPNYNFLGGLRQGGFPMSRAYMEKVGDTVAGKQPMGVGPFKFVSWTLGDRIVMERNPDFVWGPSFTHGGPAYIQTVELRSLPDDATKIAGMEAGEVGVMTFQVANLERLKKNPAIEIQSHVQVGTGYVMYMNLERAPFADVKVRQALNMMVDRDALVKLLTNGMGQVLYMPMTTATDGYCKSVEAIGYKLDLAKAKSLMTSAGYTVGSDGYYQKDGKTLALEFGEYVAIEKAAVAIQQQFKDAGVKVDLKQYEPAIWNVEVIQKGNYDITLNPNNVENSSILDMVFNTKQVGGNNTGRLKDPDMDKLLADMIATTDSKVNADGACKVLTRSVEQAYTIPLFADQVWMANSAKVKGVTLGVFSAIIELFDAYIVQ